MDSEKENKELSSLIRRKIEILGEDPERDGLKKTPERVSKSFEFLTSGYSLKLGDIVNEAIFEEDYDEMLTVRDIEFYSLCEHHLLPFYGKCHISYIPNGKILGLSKFARITDMFARRFQVQERLTNQIADAIVEILEPKGVAVITDCHHLCMMMRGVGKQESTTVASALRGSMKSNSKTRQELLSIAFGGRQI